MNRPPLEVADLVRAAGEKFIEHSRQWLTWAHVKVLRAIARCRTAALGGHYEATLAHHEKCKLLKAFFNVRSDKPSRVNYLAVGRSHRHYISESGCGDGYALRLGQKQKKAHRGSVARPGARRHLMPLTLIEAYYLRKQPRQLRGQLWAILWLPP